MADRVLREACEHGRYERHEEMVEADLPELVRFEPCSGGREVPVLQEIDAVYLEISYTRPDDGESHFGLAAGRYALVGLDNEPLEPSDGG